VTARTYIEVSRRALVANARTVAARARGARLMPMVKADGYGLGAAEVARALEQIDPWGFGVATPEEGRRLRAAGQTRPIAVFAALEEELPACAEAGLVPVLSTEAQLARWRALAPGRAFHVEVDTGMGRRGFPWEAKDALAPMLEDASGFEGLCTHFHSADFDPASVRAQWERFSAVLGALRVRPRLVHAANSAAALRHPEVAGDLVRPGIFLYGGAAGEVRPEPVVTWRSRVLEYAEREAGSNVGYDGTYATPSRRGFATLAVGYADGFPRALSNRGTVLLCGERRRVAGTVMMDMTVVEAGPEVGGGCATLLGSEGEETITVDDMASAADTISYEVLTGIGLRVERRYR
jgi:alanine racemase